MKVQWFSVLGITGIILLSGNSFGNELRWGKPADNTPTITQVQYTEPIQAPPRLAPSLTAQNPDDYLETRPQDIPVPPGATLQNAPVPVPTQVGTTVPCDSLTLKSIRDISHSIRPAPSDVLPEVCTISATPYHGRHFGQTCFMWKASALSTQAAYFEDVQLERYGNTIVCPALQPVVSGAKFFATIPLLPYKMGVTPPHECVYTLGHRRPGNCAPYMVEPFPISPRGALYQTGAVVGGAYAIP